MNDFKRRILRGGSNECHYFPFLQRPIENLAATWKNDESQIYKQNGRRYKIPKFIRFGLVNHLKDVFHFPELIALKKA